MIRSALRGARAPRTVLLVLAALHVSAAQASAQVRPDLDWQTLTSDRIRVHFADGMETLARRTLANAEWAYARLNEHLRAPQGFIDIVLADNVDFANGYATPFPSNRIVIYARPPVDEYALRNHEEWSRTVVLHEMVHIFHLDRADGPWRLARRVFGRAAPLFPNTFSPNWFIEGLAVHYESRLTRGGRNNGTEFAAHYRALATEDALPAIDALTSGRPFYPGGNTPYLFGSALVRAAVATRSGTEDEAIARLLERTSRRLNPLRLDASAREALGVTFTARYAAWKDSVRASVTDERSGALSTSTGAVRTLTEDDWTADFPRFARDGSIWYAADDARRVPGLYRLTVDGTRTRVGRRNSVDANAPADDERAVYAEFDRTDPYSLHSDLYVGRGARRRRLGVGERLTHPDVHRGTGQVVAVRTDPGATGLVVLAAIDGMPRTLVDGSLDRTYSEPRWSPSGALIAAALWERGQNFIVILDTLGREQRRLTLPAQPGGPALPVLGGPAWFPEDSALAFTSDHSGRPMVYRASLVSGDIALIWSTETALRHPDVSTDGRHLVAAELRAGGWAIVSRETPEHGIVVARADAAVAAPAIQAPRTQAEAVVLPYDAGLTGGPRWWLPALDQSDEGSLRLGAMSSGSDVVGRHSWQIAVKRDLNRPELVGAFSYSYAGLGNPVLTASVDREWVHGAIVNSANELIGFLGRASTTFSATAYFARPRVRFTTYAIAGPELAVVRFRTYPSQLLGLLSDPELKDVDILPRAVLAAGFSTMQRPGLSVSVEDGLAGQLTARRFFREGTSGKGSYELIADLSAAKSLPLPGFARHVLAARTAVGVVQGSAGRAVDVGGISGGSIEVLPGLAIGDSRRSFFVRGFLPGSSVGDRGFASSAEYRVPLRRIGRGVALVPANVQKVSALLFADAGRAWCSARVDGSPVCPVAASDGPTLASAGVEMVVDFALQYDVLYRARVGVAAPVSGRDIAPRSATVYLTFGSTF